MKIEVGKYYKARNGSKAHVDFDFRTCRFYDGDRDQPFIVTYNTETTIGHHIATENGEVPRMGEYSQWDLISEWVDEPELKWEGPGWYEMRNGNKAYIVINILDLNINYKGRQPIHGFFEKDGGHLNCDWSLTGAYFYERTSPYDLIKKIPDENKYKCIGFHIVNFNSNKCENCGKIVR